MKPEHVEEFLTRFESKSCKGYGNYITVNLHGKVHPYNERTPGQVRKLKPERISALSATYAPAVPFPPGTRLTKTGVFFASHSAGVEYLREAIGAGTLRIEKPNAWQYPRGKRSMDKEQALAQAMAQAPAMVRKVGKSWRICDSPDGGKHPIRL